MYTFYTGHHMVICSSYSPPESALMHKIENNFCCLLKFPLTDPTGVPSIINLTTAECMNWPADTQQPALPILTPILSQTDLILFLKYTSYSFI